MWIFSCVHNILCETSWTSTRYVTFLHHKVFWNIPLQTLGSAKFQLAFLLVKTICINNAENPLHGFLSCMFKPVEFASHNESVFIKINCLGFVLPPEGRMMKHVVSIPLLRLHYNITAKNKELVHCLWQVWHSRHCAIVISGTLSSVPVQPNTQAKPCIQWDLLHFFVLYEYPKEGIFAWNVKRFSYIIGFKFLHLNLRTALEILQNSWTWNHIKCYLNCNFKF